MTFETVFAELEALSSPLRAENSARFFKTGKGQYGYGDKFLGVTVPDQRKVARRFKDLPLPEAAHLLASPWHECRLTALFILVGQFEKGDASTKKAIYDIYLDQKAHINNWDLVDSSAHKIVGAWLKDKPKTLLIELAVSQSMWDRRIAVLSTFADIQRGNPKSSLQIAEILINDPEDLLQKAVGWMLREVGKRCDRAILEDFLAKHYKTMPRTMLRYAIEHFPESRRHAYLKGLA